MLHLTEQDVRRLLDMPSALRAVEEAFRQLAAGQAENVPRVRAKGPGIVLHTMSAAAAYLGLVGWKAYTTTKTAAQFHLGLCDHQSGELIALIEADHLGRLRTGATTGVAVQYLAPPEITEMGLFGTGRQARTQLEAVVAVRPIRRVFVYSRDESARVQFAEQMSEACKIEVLPVDRPQEAAEELPLVITATSSGSPVFDGNGLAGGALVCAVGSNWPHKAEIDADVIRRSDHIVCDSVECCRREAGDFTAAIDRGLFDWSRAVNLADVVAGRAVGRTRSDGLVLFKSVGMAIEDIALGAVLLERLR